MRLFKTILNMNPWLLSSEDGIPDKMKLSKGEGLGELEGDEVGDGEAVGVTVGDGDNGWML